MFETFEKFLYIFLIVLAVFVFGVQCGIKSQIDYCEMRCINAADY